jgi:hypothetical protein
LISSAPQCSLHVLSIAFIFCHKFHASYFLTNFNIPRVCL